jgi:histone H3/H4
MPIVEDQTTFVLSEPALDQPPPDDEPSVIEAFGDDAAAPMDDYGDVSDRELLEDFGDRESIEDIPSGSEEGGVEVMNDGFSDRGGDDANVTATITELEEPTREVETRRADLRVLKKRKLMSQHGIEYPCLPPAFVKRVAQTALQSSGLSNKRISTDTLAALTQASEWYFEQLGDDLGAYAQHAKRKTIEESDVATLMRR